MKIVVNELKSILGKLLRVTAVVLAALLVSTLPVCAAQTDDENKIEIRIVGLQQKDVPRLYYLGNEDTWAEALAGWLSSPPSGYDEYKQFQNSPKVLSRLSAANIKKFVQAMVPNIKTLNLTDYGTDLAWTPDSEAGDAYAGTIPKGRYLLVPQSRERIYTPQLFQPLDAKTAAFTYIAPEEDAEKAMWSMPEFTQEVTQEVTIPDHSMVAAGDLMHVNLKIKQPEYPEVYSEAKLIRSVSQMYGKGLAPDMESVLVTDAQGKTLKKEEAYTITSHKDVTVYSYVENDVSIAAFFDIGGLFYRIDGTALGVRSIEAAAEKYNTIFGKQIQQFTAQSGCTITGINFIKCPEEIMVDMDVLVEDTYYPQSEEELDIRGDIPMMSQFNYTVNPMEAEQLGLIQHERTFHSCMMEIQLLDGGIAGTGQEAEPLSGGMFGVYKLVDELLLISESATAEARTQQIENFAAAHGGVGYEAIVSPDAESSDGYLAYEVYLEIASIQVDQNGYAGIGGLEKNGYLIKQTMYPADHVTMRYGYRITESAWDNTMVQVIPWTNYTGIYLPESGGRGSGLYVAAGVCLMAAALMMTYFMICQEKKRY